MGFVPNPLSRGEIEMTLTDFQSKDEVWIALRRDEADKSHEPAAIALNVIELLEQYLRDIDEGDGSDQIRDALAQLQKLKESDDGYARYHIQGVATTKEIAVSMCRDATYLIGPLPVNVALPHSRTEWPGLHFPLREP